MNIPQNLLSYEQLSCMGMNLSRAQYLKHSVPLALSGLWVNSQILVATKQNSEKKKDWRGQPHQYQRIQDWVEDSQNWAYGDDPPQRDTGGRGAKSKLHRYRMKQNRVSGEQQNEKILRYARYYPIICWIGDLQLYHLAPRQQRAQEQRASESTAKKSWKHVRIEAKYINIQWFWHILSLTCYVCV